jgi:uncharacterized protein YbjT (DUF2867 family)
MPDKNLVLISGATGQQGGAIARELLAAGWTVRAMTRKPEGEAARALAKLGAEIVKADLDDEASLAPALAGAWGALGVQNTWEAGVEREEEQGLRFARAAKKAGVKHFVYQSVASAHRHTGIPHFENKRRIELLIETLAFESYVIIRPVFFMENLAGPWFKPYIQQGNFAIGMRPDTRLQMIAVQDIGKYGLIAFEKAAELNGRAIDIAGDELSGLEIAEALSNVAGAKLNYYQVPIEQVRAGSEDFATMLEWFDTVGYNADIAGNEKEFGVRPTRFAEWAKTQDWEVTASTPA